MKTKTILTIALFAASRAFAQSPIPASSPQAASPPTFPSPPTAPSPVQAERPATFLGVETSSVPRIVAEQLGLPRGFGLVVDHVVPESAAATAGVQQNDIIRLLNDQMLVDSNQLGKLVRSFAEGTTVDLTILRKGKEIKLPVVLKRHESKNGHDYGFENEWRWEDLPNLEDLHGPDMTAVHEAVARARDEIARAGERTREAMRNFRVVTRDGDDVQSSHVELGKAQVVYSDDKGELKIETVAGKKMLTAKDKNGKTLFHGPVDTVQEREQIPAEVRVRFENLQRQKIAPMPPDSKLAPDAPDAPEPDDSASARTEKTRQAFMAPNERSGWRRQTILL